MRFKLDLVLVLEWAEGKVEVGSPRLFTVRVSGLRKRGEDPGYPILARFSDSHARPSPTSLDPCLFILCGTSGISSMFTSRAKRYARITVVVVCRRDERPAVDGMILKGVTA